MMHSTPSPYSAPGGALLATERQQHSLWMVTFGDLLTLILCFFIAIISLSRIEKSSAAKRLAHVAEPQSAAPRLGTAIAEEDLKLSTRQGTGRSAEELALSEEELTDPNLPTLAVWTRQQQVGAEDVVEVTTCAADDEVDYLVGRVATVLATSLSRPTTVRFAELGISCAELRKRHGALAQEYTTMVVQIVKRSHG